MQLNALSSSCCFKQTQAWRINGQMDKWKKGQTKFLVAQLCQPHILCAISPTTAKHVALLRQSCVRSRLMWSFKLQNEARPSATHHPMMTFESLVLVSATQLLDKLLHPHVLVMSDCQCAARRQQRTRRSQQAAANSAF